MSAPQPIYCLIVDDIDDNLLSLEMLLRREGLVILKASSGTQALELLLVHEVSLAILDVQMPAMDGFELAELMRGMERTRHVPIMFLTAGSDDRQRRFRGYEAGAVDFMHKPVEPDILRSKAEVFFELYRQKQEVTRQRDELKLAAQTNARLLEESQQYLQALKEADRCKDEFLAMLAHELRNPLAPLRNGLQIMRMTPTEGMVDNIHDMMERQLSHLVRLIDDLMDVSRVSNGKIELRKEDITLQEALQAAIEASRPIIEAGRHTLVQSVPHTPIHMDADLTRVAQIINNLLNNAAKYTPEGGTIELSVKLEGQEAYITVSDNGVGIPAEMLPKVFGLFTQVDRNLERSQGGLGIGLALVKRLVEMHGGSVTAHSGGIGMGSSFTVRLPYTQAQEAPAVPAPRDEPLLPVGERLRVLVVDDNVASAKTIGWMLEMMGHELLLVHHGLEVEGAARSFMPDIILMDIGLPGMNGYDICRLLRKDATFKDIVIIAQTGWGQESDRRQALEAGFNHHLTKPVNFEKFSELVATVSAQRLSKTA